MGLSLKMLLLQPVTVMTLDVMKDLRTSLDKVVARVMDDSRRREDRLEREPERLEPRQV